VCQECVRDRYVMRNVDVFRVKRAFPDRLQFPDTLLTHYSKSVSGSKLLISKEFILLSDTRYI
jgi:hypothetical protein